MSSSTTTSTVSASPEIADQKKWSTPIINSKIGTKLRSSKSDYTLTEAFVAILCALCGSITGKEKPESIDDLTSKGCQTQSSWLSPLKILSIANGMSETVVYEKLDEFKNYSNIMTDEKLTFPNPSALTMENAEEIINCIGNGEDLSDETTTKLANSIDFVVDYLNWLLELTHKDFVSFIRSGNVVKYKMVRKSKKQKEGDTETTVFTETEDEYETRLETRINELARVEMLHTRAWVNGMGRIVNMVFNEEKKVWEVNNDDCTSTSVFIHGYEPCKMHTLNVASDEKVNVLPLEGVDKLCATLFRGQTSIELADGCDVQKKYGLFLKDNAEISKFKMMALLNNDLMGAIVDAESGNMAAHIFTRTDKKREFTRVKMGMSKQCQLAQQAGFELVDTYITKKSASTKRKRDAEETSKKIARLRDENRQIKEDTILCGRILNYLIDSAMFDVVGVYNDMTGKPAGVKIITEACLNREVKKNANGQDMIEVTAEEITEWNTQFNQQKEQNQQKGQSEGDSDEDSDSDSAESNAQEEA